MFENVLVNAIPLHTVLEPFVRQCNPSVLPSFEAF